MARGTVLELYRFPVKSMGGERLDAVALDEHGFEGDRNHAVWFRRGRRLSARAAPRMLAWHASLNGGLRITAPDGRSFRWDDELKRAVSEYLGKDVDLTRDPHGLGDVPDTLLVTIEGSRRQLEDELGMPLDIRRFRPNVHVDLGGAAPFEESGWEGRRIRIGEAELEIVHPCDRCAITIYDPETQEKAPDVLRVINDRHGTFFGFRAKPLGPARIAVGDPVEVV